MTKYLSEKEITAIIGDIVFDSNFYTMSQDSYNEELIAKKIVKMNPTELCYASINMATIGYGNQKYGQFRLGDSIVNIQSLFQKYNIKYNNPRSAILKEDDITAQRLCRFYRYKIREFILARDIETYMYRKYSVKDPKYKHVCFRGAEYLDDLNPDEQEYLLATVKKMDEKMGSNIADRVLRVFSAKNNYRSFKS
jgi:hypothetical protein